jgi:hypothetical protein
MLAKVGPPPIFSATPSSTSAEAPAELVEVAVAEAAAAEAVVFCFFPTALDTPPSFLFFDSAATVAFLVAAFFDFSSIDARTFRGTLCSS